MSMVFRTPATAAQYALQKKKMAQDTQCPLCLKKPIVQFTYWKIVPNDFPYDAIADTHDMLVLCAHKTSDQITEEEWEEYHHLKATEAQRYDYVLENTERNSSVLGHFHSHLITSK